jgi:MerR family transcriptional regulator, copper efflux regulator
MPRQSDNRPHRLPLAGESAGLVSLVARDPSPAVSPHPLEVPRALEAPKAWSGDEAEEDLLQVGDLARISGKTVRAIHLYEELGLLKPHARSKGRYRLFSQDSVVRVRWIGKLQDLGLSLPTIQTVVREWGTSPSAPGAMAKMREVYLEKLASTREQIRRLTALETELSESLKYLETCDTCNPVRLTEACNCCDLHDDNQVPPELVAGFHLT